ncbi:neuronal acetylcholine receptor subunit beta-3-like [Neodiprion pinetum]|uniref:neuronal acetylcholine receptor subunit beta-3-like n=1 Tax=Neodiprion pinetum TaxID=441929 RepID=UPI001EDEBF98|nr:neuronal acetylcholine receptor subunit beta-3-like [Neodiprion pinetum]
MTRLLVLGFILLAINNTIQFSVDKYSQCPEDRVKNRSMTLQLRKHLFCDYDNYVRPSLQQDNATKVYLELIPKFIEFDDHANTLVLHAWMALIWTDEHLSWNISKFGNLNSLQVSSDELWIPHLYVYNSGNLEREQYGIPKTDCVLHSSGRVACVPALKYTSHCIANYQHWPFDSHNCTLYLGSWSHTGEEIDYSFIHRGVIQMPDFTPNPQWKLLSISALKKVERFEAMNYTFPRLVFNVVVERHSTFMQTTILAPAIVLIVLTMMVLWLNPMTSERMVLAALNLICHLLCIIDVNWQVPFNGDTLPSILVFHQNSLVIASVVLFLTALLRQLKQISIPAPVWLTSITSFILERKAGQFILLATLDPKNSTTLGTTDDNVGLIQSSATSSRINPESFNAWHHFATLLNRLSFIAVLLTYVIMISVLLPK